MKTVKNLRPCRWGFDQKQILRVLAKYFPDQTIWIVGSSLIKRAERHVAARPMGINLALERYGFKCYWSGKSGLRTEGVLQLLLETARVNPMPKYIVLHFGGNDIGLVSLGLLRHQIKDTLKRIQICFPDVILIWSDILPRSSWRESINVKAMDQARRRLNRDMCYFLTALGHKVMKHTDFHYNESTLLHVDGVHLSFIGNDIFLNSVQGALETFITQPDVSVYPVNG